MAAPIRAFLHQQGLQVGTPATVRLLDMGVVTGAEIRLKHKAPLGDPLEFTVKDYQISLRKEEAASGSASYGGCGGCSSCKLGAGCSSGRQPLLSGWALTDKGRAAAAQRSEIVNR